MTTSERAKLRSIASGLKDIVYIGKEDLTDNVIEQININLFAHEMIKIKVQKGCDTPLKELANKIAEICNAEVVETIGSKIVVYKKTEKENFKHLL